MSMFMRGLSAAADGRRVNRKQMLRELSSSDSLPQFFTIWASASSLELILSPAREAASRLMSKCTC